MTSEAFLFIFAAVIGFWFGAVLGSAYLCYRSRKKKNEPWTRGRSHCDSCGHTLSALELIPVISYLCQRGKCRHCGAKIPRAALIYELMFGLGVSALSVISLVLFA